MKAYKVTFYSTDIEGKRWCRDSEEYYTNEAKAKASADQCDGFWWRAEVEEITINED